MELKNLEVLSLHKHPEYLKPCCDLINDEWPRSETARMMSLTASCDKLPTSLVLIEQKQVIGHCKLTSIPSIQNSCFIETVVIRKSMRGKKLGTHLMNKVEEYCKDVLRLDMVHLSTKGQENFYAKLGYEICPPISIYGNSLPRNYEPTDASVKKEVPVVLNSFAPPPPPMPKPQVNLNHSITSSKTFMCKYL